VPVAAAGAAAAAAAAARLFDAAAATAAKLIIDGKRGGRVCRPRAGRRRRRHVYQSLRASRQAARRPPTDRPFTRPGRAPAPHVLSTVRELLRSSVIGVLTALCRRRPPTGPLARSVCMMCMLYSVQWQIQTTSKPSGVLPVVWAPEHKNSRLTASLHGQHG